MRLFRIEDDKRHIRGVPRRSMKSLKMGETSNLEDWVLEQQGAPFERRLLWIARQDAITSDQRSDLIGLDAEGNLVICELKRGMASEQAISQALGYAAEYRHLDVDGLAEVLFRNAGCNRLGSLNFEDLSEARIHLNESIATGSAASATEVEVNQSQVVMIVAESFPANMLSVCDYLNDASDALTFWFECWQYELFTEDSDNAGTYVTFSQILPPINVRSEIAERRDAERSRKYARDPDRTELSKRLQETFAQLDEYEATRNRGASYTFSVTPADGTHVFSVRVGHDNPWLVVPDDTISGMHEGSTIDGGKLRQSGREWGFLFEKFGSNEPERAEELAGKMRSVMEKIRGNNE